MKIFLSSILVCALAFGASGKEMTVKGFDNREVILNSDGTWKYAKPPVKLEQPLGSEFSVQVFEARRQIIFTNSNPEPKEIVVLCAIRRNKPPKEYDPPFDLAACIIDAESGNELANARSASIGPIEKIRGFVLSDDIVKEIRSNQAIIGEFHFENSKVLQKANTINLKISLKKSYTPPPNEFSSVFKDLPISGE